jgi:hypothetical protein
MSRAGSQGQKKKKKYIYIYGLYISRALDGNKNTTNYYSTTGWLASNI